LPKNEEVKIKYRRKDKDDRILTTGAMVCISFDKIT